MTVASTPLRFVARVRRAVRLGYHASGAGVVEFYNSYNLTYASSIAYYSLLSFFPFVLLIATILARLAGEERLGSLEMLIQRVVPGEVRFLTEWVHQLGETSLQFGVLGTLLTLWASMGVFGALTSAVNHAWGVESPYGFFKHKLVAFVMMSAAGLLLMTVLLLVGVTEVFSTRALMPTFIVVVGLIYYFAPNAEVRFRDVWFGAVLAGVLWQGAFIGFTWYVRAFSRFSAASSIGTVIAFLIWVYVSAVILLYGVEVTAAYARARQRIPVEMPAAPPLQE